MPFRFPLFAALFAVAMPLLAAAAENWPQFRGPTGDGHSDAKGLPLLFSETANVKWKTYIHGKAWSSPVIWGSQVWLTSANEQGTELSVFCVDKETGKILRYAVLFQVANPQEGHRFNSYASPTPVIEEGRIYITFGSPGTACLDIKTGEVLWQRTDLRCNHFRGAGSSPILWENLLIMNFDGSDFQYVVALDKKTGQTVWKTDRSVDYHDQDPGGNIQGGGDFRKAFSTPEVAMVEGRPVLFSSGAKAHYAYDPRTGHELWRFEEQAQHSASTRPVLGFGLVYFLTGFSKGQLLAVKIPPMAAAPDAPPRVLGESDLAWRMKKGMPSKPSLLLIDDLVYTVDDIGIAACLEAKTGTEVWRQRISGSYSASPIYADGKIYYCSEDGKVTVIAPGREFNLLGENKLTDGIMASPAVSGKALYVRTKTALYRLEE